MQCPAGVWEIDADDLLLEGIMACAWQVQMLGLRVSYRRLSPSAKAITVEHRQLVWELYDTYHTPLVLEGPTAHFSHSWC